MGGQAKLLALFSTQLDICWTGVFILQLVKMIKRFLMRGRLIMRKNTARNGIVITLAAMIAMTAMAGCGKNVSEGVADASDGSAVVETLTDESAPLAADIMERTEIPAAPYFFKGVYVNYPKEAENPPKEYFYVFSEDTYGYTADGNSNDIGLPFSIEQSDGKVDFSFGGEGETKDVLIITGADNGVVYGYFEDIPERELVFELLADADPEGFSAVNYLNSAKGEDLVYSDANGWSVKYNPNSIEVNTAPPITTFVYTGYCPGTCMITVTYGVDMDASAKAEELAKSYGDAATVNDTIFPGTDDVKGFYVDAVPGQTGPGLYESAYVRDYMGGYLTFEFTDHVCGDDEIDMPISDALSAVIDSLTFDFE